MSIAIATSMVAPAYADWNDMTDKELKTCTEAIFGFEASKVKAENSYYDNFPPGSRGFGTDLTVMYLEHKISLEFDETQKQCASYQKMQRVASLLHEQQRLKTWFVTDRLDLPSVRY
ncbi:hypothetical protein [Pleurocapsa sp. FMAR1]|uniref:hypothetical protein n=1 Tax=Pleurocapsa sp. FMAR1 TaxID=3040204 RepID=UPI0029C66730|nr:hypothetical protein [Pleurocapsa sp. FMAR1]